jgi:hypothetical protein
LNRQTKEKRAKPDALVEIPARLKVRVLHEMKESAPRCVQNKGVIMPKPILLLVLLLFALGAQAQTKSRTKTIRPTLATTLSIEAAVIYESGDVKPVARTQFILLDEDLNTILKPFPRFWKQTDSLLLFLSSLELEELELSLYGDTRPGTTEVRAEIEQVQKAIAALTVATVTTDFGGKATFEGLAPGRRFIYGRFKAGNNRLF